MEDGIDVLLEDVTDINAEVKAGAAGHPHGCPQRLVLVVTNIAIENGSLTVELPFPNGDFP